MVAVGVPHHITQRGNNQQDVFLLDEDRRQYLKALAEDSARYGMRLLGWCLMTNHVHLVAVAEREDAFARGWFAALPLSLGATVQPAVLA